VASRHAARAVANFGPDVIHVHEPFAPLLGYAAVFAHRAPLMATYHRSGVGSIYTLARPILRSIVRAVDAHVAVSAAAAETARRAPASSATFSSTVSRPSAGSHWSEATSWKGPTACSSDCLEERKGVRTAVEAFVDGSLGRLVVIGDGPLASELQQRCSETTSVVFVGAVDDLTKRQIVAGAEVAVAPALFGESFGLGGPRGDGGRRGSRGV
jgi:phosphatidylinositol alpha-mannosyltransferase